MKKQSVISIVTIGVFVFSGIAAVAWAGVEPSPFRVRLQNTTNTLPSSSPFYNGSIHEGVIDFYFANVGDDVPTLWASMNDSGIEPGQTKSHTEWEVNPELMDQPKKVQRSLLTTKAHSMHMVYMYSPFRQEPDLSLKTQDNPRSFSTQPSVSHLRTAE